MSVSVSPVAGKKDLERFLAVPGRIYADDPYYVHPLLSQQREFLDSARNPFHAHAVTRLWLARRDGEVVGRIGACVDRYHNDHHGELTGFFGFYECDDDPEASAALLQTARDWLVEQGMETMRGPLSFTTNHDGPGIQVAGERTSPVTGMAYNPTYYEKHLDAFGLVKSKDLWAWRVRVDDMQIPDRVTRSIDAIKKHGGIRIRPIDMDRFDEEVEMIRRIYNDSWSGNWGFIPMDPEEFRFSAKEMKRMVNKHFIPIAEYKGKPVGFCMTVPDFNIALKPCKGRLFPFGFLKFLVNRKKIKYARTLLLGVLPEARHRGLDVLLVFYTFKAGFKGGITSGECSWILEDNKPMNRILSGMGGDKYKTYRVYDLPLK